MDSGKHRYPSRLKGATDLPRHREKSSPDGLHATAIEQERALLVGITPKSGRNTRWELADSMGELGQLVRSAGGEVIGEVTQNIDHPTSVYVGHGKLEEIKESRVDSRYTVVVFNDELKPSQQRNLERELEVKVLDRSALILDIFASRARTKEGVLQVELAQHEYLLPRLAGQWSHLERLGGGIGTRGPGRNAVGDGPTPRARAHQPPQARSRGRAGPPVAAPQSTASGADAGGLARGVHQRRQEHALQRAGSRGRRRGGQAILHVGPQSPAAWPCRTAPWRC